jgi:hypothetical protein
MSVFQIHTSSLSASRIVATNSKAEDHFPRLSFRCCSKLYKKFALKRYVFFKNHYHTTFRPLPWLLRMCKFLQFHAAVILALSVINTTVERSLQKPSTNCALQGHSSIIRRCKTNNGAHWSGVNSERSKYVRNKAVLLAHRGAVKGAEFHMWLWNEQFDDAANSYTMSNPTFIKTSHLVQRISDGGSTLCLPLFLYSLELWIFTVLWILCLGW